MNTGGISCAYVLSPEGPKTLRLPKPLQRIILGLVDSPPGSIGVFGSGLVTWDTNFLQPEKLLMKVVAKERERSGEFEVRRREV